MAITDEAILTAIPPALNYDKVNYPRTSQSSFALADIKGGLYKWRIWSMLAYQDIKLRYRRSVLGPFWLTLSMAITVYSMGFLYAHLFHVELQRYYPFLVSGMLTWTLISTLVIELTDGLTSYEGFIKGIKLPYTLHIHRIAARNVLIFFHNLIVMVPIVCLFHEVYSINWNTLLMVPGLLIIYFNSLIYGLGLSMIGARYRDISQVIKSLVQVIFFITPVMWSGEALSAKNHWIMDLNPFYSFIQLVRAPLLGMPPTLNNLIMVGVMTILGIVLCFSIFARYRARIIYWL